MSFVDLCCIDLFDRRSITWISSKQKMPSNGDIYRQSVMLQPPLAQNTAPVDMGNIPLFTGYHTCQVVVWDFCHQQYGAEQRQHQMPLLLIFGYP